jgi:hypothetical protein
MPRRSITLRATRTWERMELERKIAAAAPSMAGPLRRSLAEHGPHQPELRERDPETERVYWRQAPANAGLPPNVGWPFSEEELELKREEGRALRCWLDQRGMRW